MKILSLYINEQGVIFGSDQMPPKEPPKFQSKEWYQKYSESFNEANPNQSYSHDCREYEQSLTLWKSQAIRFENQEEAREVFRKAFFELNSASSIVFQPDSVLPLSNPIECEVKKETKYKPVIDEVGVIPQAYWEKALSIKSQPQESNEVTIDQLINALDDKRILKFTDSLTSDMWYLSRKQTAEFLLDNFTITRK